MFFTCELAVIMSQLFTIIYFCIFIIRQHFKVIFCEFSVIFNSFLEKAALKNYDKSSIVKRTITIFFDVLTVLPIRKEITKLIPSNFHFLCIFLHKKIGVFFIITFVDWNTFILMSDLRNLFLKNRV